MTSTSERGKPRKPKIALAIATALGLGYLRPAPGTWGSLGGLLVTWALTVIIPFSQVVPRGRDPYGAGFAQVPTIFGSIASPGGVSAAIVFTIVVACVGIWAATQAENYLGHRDPHKVVIDEVSGQQVTLLLGGAWYFPLTEVMYWPTSGIPLGAYQLRLTYPNWKYFLLGFILFRVFDIWKPFPVRQAEKLPGGWGIMADDWLAAIYAALGLWVARVLGL